MRAIRGVYEHVQPEVSGAGGPRCFGILVALALLMTLATSVGRSGTSAPSRGIEWLARVGFVAKGLLYGTVGTLATCAGLGQGGGTADSRGALSVLHEMPFGDLLLVGIAIGLVGYGIWRIVEGFVDPDDRGRDAKGIALRSSFVARGVLHLALAFSAARMASLMPRSWSWGPGDDSGNAAASYTATAIELPGGRWIVLGVGLGLGAFGLWQVIRAFRAKLNRNVDKQDAEREIGGWVIAVSRVGIAARGLVFMAIGWLVGLASVREDPSQAGGIDRGLDVFAAIGRWPLVAIGIGLIAYGIYQLLSARYRRIRV